MSDTGRVRKMSSVCKRCGKEVVGARDLIAHDCPETNPKGSLAWHFAGENHDLADYEVLD